MIKHKTVSKFLLQPSFDIFMQDSFNIISLNLKFHIKSTQLGNCWKFPIFNQSMSHMLKQFIETLLAWIYFFLIDITLFSCYVSLAIPFLVKLFGLDFFSCKVCQLYLDVLVQAPFRKWNQGWWSRISQALN